MNVFGIFGCFCHLFLFVSNFFKFQKLEPTVDLRTVKYDLWKQEAEIMLHFKLVK